MDFSALACSTVEFLKPHLLVAGGKLAADGLSAAREKLFSWLKEKFTRPAQAGALEEATAAPEDATNLEALTLQIRKALEQDETFRRELAALLPKENQPGFSQNIGTVSGDNNKLGQAQGGSTIHIS